MAEPPTQLPIEILEYVVDFSAGYTRLLGSLGLASRTLTARTRAHMFHTVHLGTPNGPHPYDRHIRFYKEPVSTRCDAFLDLCIHNPSLPLYVRALIISQSVWHPTIGMPWVYCSHSIIPLLHRLNNLDAFTIRTEGIITTLSPPLEQLLAFVLGTPSINCIDLSDIGFFDGSNLFRIFKDATPHRVLKISDVAFDLWNQFIPDLPGYRPLQIDTLVVGFDVRFTMEERFIRHTLQRPCPLLEMQHIRCLKIQVHHAVGSMHCIHAWISMTPLVEELHLHIFPGNKALRWRNKHRWRYWQSEPFDNSLSLQLSRLREATFRMLDHTGVGKIAIAMQYISLAGQLRKVTILFSSARGPLDSIDEEAWRQVDATLSRAAAFPLLESIEICFGRNSYAVQDLEEKLRESMPTISDILRIIFIT